MALNQQAVRVANTGSVYVAAELTPMPPDLDTLASPWAELGYVTTDGVTFTISRETSDLNAWQGDKIRVLTTAEPMTVEFALMETTPNTLVTALGGGTIETTGTAPDVVTTYTPEKGANTIRAMVIEFVDGAVSYRYCLPRVQIEGDVSWQLLRSDSVNYPLTFGVLDADPKYTIISNDPEMDDTGLDLLLAGGHAAPAAAPTEEFADA